MVIYIHSTIRRKRRGSFALRLRAVIATNEQAFSVQPNVTSVGVKQLEACRATR